MQDDPERFARIQRGLGTDALNEYVKTTVAGVFAIPPGIDAGPGRFVGEALLA